VTPKLPRSVLVVIHTQDGEVLLLDRADRPGFWQSVTGSLDVGETALAAAIREVKEETGIQATTDTLLDWQLSNRFEIFPQWRHRYADSVDSNVEYVFSLCLPKAPPITLSDEHLGYSWLPWRRAAAKCFSWSNRDAICILAGR